MVKTQWSDWNGVFEIYNDPVKNVAGLPVPLAFVPSESTQILDAVMRKMRCHGNKKDALETPLQGGISGALPQSTSGMAQTFRFSSSACSCVYDYHTYVFESNYVTNPKTLDEIKELGLAYTTTGLNLTRVGSNTPADPLMKQCFFSKRMPHSIELVPDCFPSVSPYMVVLYINTIAGIFGAMYLVSGGENARSGERSMVVMWKQDVVKWMRHPMATVFFVVLNVGLGVAGVILSSGDGSAGSIVAVCMVEGLALVYAMGMTWYMSHQADEIVPAPIQESIVLGEKKLVPMSSSKSEKAFKDAIYENVNVIQRMSFWFQYIVTLPGIVVLHDVMQQQRIQEYMLARVAFALGIGFLAAGSDMLCLFNDKVMDNLAMVAENKEDGAKFRKKVMAKTDDNIRSAMWWCVFLLPHVDVTPKLIFCKKQIHTLMLPQN